MNETTFTIGWSLVCCDKVKQVYLWQKGSDYAVVEFSLGTKKTQYFKGKTQDEGFEKAEEVYYELIQKL